MSKWLNYQIKPDRFRTVLGDITRGSEPAGRFYILVGSIHDDRQFRSGHQQHRGDYWCHARGTDS